MKIEYLADRQKDIPTIIDWLYQQWGHNYEYGKEVWIERVNNRLNKEKVPTTFVAIISGQPVATASIIESDMDTRKDLTPWLADVYTLPEYRGNKIATKLIDRVLKEAKKIGISRVYLYTREAKGLYQKNNWDQIKTTNYYGDQIVLMKYDLD